MDRGVVAPVAARLRSHRDHMNDDASDGFGPFVELNSTVMRSIDPATGPWRHTAVRVVQPSHRSYTPPMELLKTGRTIIIARGVAWVVSLLLLGLYFGKLPFVGDQFHYVVFAVIFISILPLVRGWAPPRWASRTDASTVEASRQSQRG